MIKKINIQWRNASNNDNLLSKYRIYKSWVLHGLDETTGRVRSGHLLKIFNVSDWVSRTSQGTVLQLLLF